MTQNENLCDGRYIVDVVVACALRQIPDVPKQTTATPCVDADYLLAQAMLKSGDAARYEKQAVGQEFQDIWMSASDAGREVGKRLFHLLTELDFDEKQLAARPDEYIRDAIISGADAASIGNFVDTGRAVLKLRVGASCDVKHLFDEIFRLLTGVNIFAYADGCLWDTGNPIED